MALAQPDPVRAELVILEVQGVRQQCYALVDQKLENGLRSLAVPIVNARGEVRAAINVGANAARRSLRELRGFAGELHKAACKLALLKDLNR